MLSRTADAARRTDTSPADKRPCPLAKLEWEAAREMADNLALSRWLSDIKARERSGRERAQQRLTDIGHALRPVAAPGR